MFTVEENAVVFANGKRKQFPRPIAETLAFDDAIVVRLKSEPFLTNENVFGLDYQGNSLWQIPWRAEVQGLSPYVALWRKDHMYVEAYNWNGYSLLLHPRLGTVLHEGTSYGAAIGSKRSASRRIWI